MTFPEVACGINVYCSDPDDPGFAAALEDMAAIGYTHIAFGPMSADATDLPALTKLLADSGIRPIAMAGLTPEADVSSPDPQVRARGLDLLKATVDFAHDLGADQLNGVSYALFGDRRQPPAPERVAGSAELLGQAADYAHQAGIAMTFEVVNRYETSMLNTAQQAVDFVALSGSQNLKIHLDTYHMAIEESDIATAIRSAGALLGYLELGQSGRGSLLSGAVDIHGVVREARAAGYTGRLGLEAFSRQVIDAGTADYLAIWRTTYADPHTVAAEAFELVRSVYLDEE